jgi:aminopeptidase YwaD
MLEKLVAEKRLRMKAMAVMVVGLMMGAGAWGQKAPLLEEKDVAALANELSGETAKRNLEGIARFHRQRGSKGFHEAAELVAERLRAYGLSDVAILEFPADGATMYGTQRSRPAWDAEFGELAEVDFGGPAPCGRQNSDTAKGTIIADCVSGKVSPLESYEAEPAVLAEDSESADVMRELVDVGEGTKEGDYAGKNVKGKIVLVSAQPGAVQDLAVGKFGAVGIVSYAQNQKTAWSGENLDAIRWGHLETFSANKTFAFMVSLRTARGFQEHLAKGDWFELHAVVRAGQHAGNYEVVTATIPGADPKLNEEEIVYSCHLDHQRPGANDNASGCATILEVARTLQKLISQEEKAAAQLAPHLPISIGRLARPARTIRFVFPPEIEGTMALLNAKPEMARRIKAVVHMDMVGGGPETKAMFHVTRGPMSLPSFVQDIAWAFAEWVNEESYEFAATGQAKYPLVAPEGGREPLRAEYSAYSMGSDHDVYQDSSFGIPAIYLNDWPDQYIHTNLDTAGNIDTTKLKRAAFIGAASGYFLANMKEENLPVVMRLLTLRSLRMVLEIAEKRNQVSASDGGEIQRFENSLLRPLLESAINFIDVPFERIFPALTKMGENLDRNNEGMSLKTIISPDDTRVYRRNPNVKGPLMVFGYDYFEAEWAKRAHVTKPQLLEYEGLWGGGEEYAYEVLNFANGKRNTEEIRDAVSAEYGPVPVEMVVEYLKALEEIGVVEEVKEKK